MNAPMKQQSATFADYIAHGWQLCAIPAGEKGPTSPGWNEAGVDEIPEGMNAGLLHSLSNTAAIDIDHLELAVPWFAERGVDLQALLDAPDAVQIVSGRQGSAKLLYALPGFMAMASKKVTGLLQDRLKTTIVEFRCASAEGKPVQDVLSGSRHPSGTTYQWAGKGNWKQLPALPDVLRNLWIELLNEQPTPKPKQSKDGTSKLCTLEQLPDLLGTLDPDLPYEGWRNVGMGCRAEFGDAAYPHWLAWSSRGEKFKNERECVAQWASFKDKPAGVGIGFGSVVNMALEAGWQVPPPDVQGMFGAVPQSGGAAGGGSVSVQLIKASDVPPENVDWLWKHWLAKGKIHIAAGAPGTGKTTIALRLSAIVSNGGAFPDGFVCEAGNVLIWSGEDAIADTLVPRLMAAGANMERVFFVNDIGQGDNRIAFDPAIHMPELEIAARMLGNVSLLIVDSIADVIAGDSHKNAEVRRGLRPLADFGQQTGCAIFGIAHFNKGSGGKDPLERVMGSAAFGAVARVVYGCAKIIENDVLIRRVFARAKSNIGPDGDGFEYGIHMLTMEKGIEASRVEFGQPITGTAREILSSPDEGGGNPDEGQKMTNAMNFLREILKDGPVDSNIIKTQGKDEFGITMTTMRRAKEKLGIQAHQVGKGIWQWVLLPEFPEVKQQ